jgi:SsrA-binding protein
MSARAIAVDGKVLASNRQAFHNFFIGDRYEAGIVLLGTEVYLFNCHIPPYDHGGYANHDPLRARKLLLHREEILRLAQRTRSGGETLVPLRLYLQKGRVKIEVALARGKKLWDKREAARRHDQEREARAARGRREPRAAAGRSV